MSNPIITFNNSSAVGVDAPTTTAHVCQSKSCDPLPPRAFEVNNLAQSRFGQIALEPTGGPAAQKKVSTAKEHEHTLTNTLFSFDSNVIAACEPQIWQQLEEAITNDTYTKDELFLIKDTYIGEELELPVGVLKNICSLLKQGSSLAFGPLSLSHLCQTIQIIDSKDSNVTMTLPIATIWESSETFRQLYTGSKSDAVEKNLSMPLEDVGSLRHLFGLEHVHPSNNQKLLSYIQLWNNADRMNMPQKIEDIARKIEVCLDASHPRILDDENVLLQLRTVLHRAKAQNYPKIKKALDTLVQKWFDKKIKDLKKQGCFLKSAAYISSFFFVNPIAQQLTRIAQHLHPISLSTELTEIELLILKQTKGIDFLHCYYVDTKKIELLTTVPIQHTHLAVYGHNLTPADLQQLQNLDTLELLSLSWCHTIRSPDLAHLRNIKNLQVLNLLNMTQLTSLDEIQDIPLKEVALGNCFTLNKEAITQFLLNKPYFKITCPYGITYEGSLVNGLRHGEGKLSSSIDLEYIGSFENGVKSGRGTLFMRSTGIKTTYNWVNDEIAAG